jgi:hypothetical protein
VRRCAGANTPPPRSTRTIVDIGSEHSADPPHRRSTNALAQRSHEVLEIGDEALQVDLE